MKCAIQFCACSQRCHPQHQRPRSTNAFMLGAIVPSRNGSDRQHDEGNW
jgi:hypothetical protein